MCATIVRDAMVPRPAGEIRGQQYCSRHRFHFEVRPGDDQRGERRISIDDVAVTYENPCRAIVKSRAEKKARKYYLLLLLLLYFSNGSPYIFSLFVGLILLLYCFF